VTGRSASEPDHVDRLALGTNLLRPRYAILCIANFLRVHLIGRNHLVIVINDC
jgi:hypothetical protein